MVVTNDGLVVAQSLGPRYREDIVAGLSSYLAMSTNKALEEGGLSGFESFTLHAAHGKSVLWSIGEAILIVLMDQFAEVESARRDIQAAAQRLRRTARIS